MHRVVVMMLFFMMAGSAVPQEAAKPAPAGKATVIGCLTGPDADDHYTLTSMQHRTGVEVVGGEELKKGAGAKVKLTGTWEPLPGSTVKTDATQRFKAAQVVVLEEKCPAPQAVTPVSKKKQQQQK
jgi:hypothetical protein